MAQLEALNAAAEDESAADQSMRDLQQQQLAMEQKLRKLQFLRSEVAARALLLQEEAEAEP